MQGFGLAVWQCPGNQREVVKSLAHGNILDAHTDCMAQHSSGVLPLVFLHGPGFFPAPDDVHMEMKHHLTGLPAVIENNPISVGYAIFFGEFTGYP
jgi:hypothetical protein